MIVSQITLHVSTIMTSKQYPRPIRLYFISDLIDFICEIRGITLLIRQQSLNWINRTMFIMFLCFWMKKSCILIMTLQNKEISYFSWNKPDGRRSDMLKLFRQPWLEPIFSTRKLISSWNFLYFLFWWEVLLEERGKRNLSLTNVISSPG